jgi:hypothetical protein
MSIVVLLALAWLAANAALVLMLRRNARLREQGGPRPLRIRMPREAAELASKRARERATGRAAEPV